jgi:hypothetical protein
MVCSAVLAARSPPRFNRWRSVRPELAGDGCDSAQVSEGSFGAQPLRIVPGGDQELASDLSAHTGQSQQFRCGGGYQRRELSVESRISSLSCW